LQEVKNKDISSEFDRFQLGGLIPKISGPFLPISTSKMLIYSKKSPKKFKKLKNVEIFNPRKIMIYQIHYKNLVKKY
jgi:hypothetical protein